MLTCAISMDATPPDAEKGAEVADCGWGEPMSLDWEREGEARDSRGLLVPPSLLAPPCAAATAEGSCECADGGIVRPREEYSSWLPDCCCTPVFDGEKGDEVDDTEELRLIF
jgi:hypothetical protein